MWEENGQLVMEKSPGLAAGLGLLPGGGSFYTGEIGAGIVDLLFWPLSMFWDPIVGLNAAEMRNYVATRRQQKKKMNRELAQLLEDRKKNDMDDETYKLKKRQIHEKHFIDDLIDW